MAAPSCSSPTGSAGKAATASSYRSYPPSGCSASTMSHRSTRGHNAGSCRATSRWAHEVTSTLASQSLTMYATSAAER